MSEHVEHHDDHNLGYILDEDASTSSISVMAGLLLVIALLSAIVLLTLLFMGHSQNVAPEAALVETFSNLLA